MAGQLDDWLTACFTGNLSESEWLTKAENVEYTWLDDC